MVDPDNRQMPTDVLATDSETAPPGAEALKLVHVKETLRSDEDSMDGHEML